MDVNSEELTTICTRYEIFKYKIMSFELTNRPSTFQHFINAMIMDCLDIFITAFVSNILIYSLNVKEHQEHVQKVLKQLCKTELQAIFEKCKFNITCIMFLRFIISLNRIEVNFAKTLIIKNWSHPRMVREVQSLLRFCNFYRQFIEDYSWIAKPLNCLTWAGQPFQWDFSSE